MDLNLMMSKREIMQVVLIGFLMIMVLLAYFGFFYIKGNVMKEKGEYKKAINNYHYVDTFSFVQDKENECYYQLGIECRENKDFNGALSAFFNLFNYKDSVEQVREIYYQYGEYLYNLGDYEMAQEYFNKIGNYKNVDEYLSEIE